MQHTENIPLISMLPFVLMLASIAVLPLVASDFWEKNRNKLFVSIGLSVPTVIYLLMADMSHELTHIILFDYIPFIILLGSLFVITGGIFIEGDLKSTPLTNTLILLTGAVLASFIGTTGAAMLLIRFILQINKGRKFKVHTVLFFIATVANSGGLLTPLGDPPLFMMYLRGADFFWFFGLFKEWAFANTLILIIYFVTDKYYMVKEGIKSEKNEKLKLKIHGKINFIFLLGVIAGVAFINQNYVQFIRENPNLCFARDMMLVMMAFLSIYFTKYEIRRKNHFSWEPMAEVAYLFIGIFITMVPALEYLKIHANELGITAPSQFYYATGILSSFLDNTPTAVTFYYLEVGLVNVNPEILIPGHIVAGIPDNIMSAISVAAVFFGSMTYIGNGPNFMVKAIAESQGIKMPDFFSYMFKFSIIVLLPVFVIIQLLFI
jgi:Na+/H+ antiporter NhaD/arsenite permease-like protein